MDSILVLLFITIGAVFVLLPLSAITQAARRRASQSIAAPAPASLPLPDEDSSRAGASEDDVQLFPYPENNTALSRKTAEYWWSELFSGGAVLGAIFLLIEPVIILINSYILALRLELLLGHAGDSLFTLSILQWEREITLFDLAALLISVIQVIAAAALAYLWNTLENKFNATFMVALGTWGLIFFVEVALSAWSGGVTDKRVMLLNATFAAALVLAESLVGIFGLELFLIPLVLSVAWTMALPVRVVVKFVRLRASRYWLKPCTTSQAAATSLTKPKRVSSLLGALDSIFQPLRKFDALVYRLLRRITKGSVNKETKGEIVCANSN